MPVAVDSPVVEANLRSSHSQAHFSYNVAYSIIEAGEPTNGTVKLIEREKHSTSISQTVADAPLGRI